MSAHSRCPQCGSSDIVEDAHYAQEQLVCADCGCILTEGVLTTTQQEENFLQAVRFSESTGQNETISRTKLKGIIRVRNLCRVLRLPDNFADTAVSYYEQIFYHPMCHSVSQEKKEAIMGCCVYVACRQHHWPLTMGTISSLLYSTDQLFSEMFRKLIQALNIDLPSLSIRDLVKTHCNSLKLLQNSSSAPSKYIENLDKVLQRTLQIVELAADTWLVTGRHPIPIITAAAYLSWQSLKPAQRLSCKLTQFCKLCEIDFQNPAPKRLNEFIDIFLKLGQQLPWLKMLSLTRKTVIQHLEDILKHRAYLLRKALEAAEAAASEVEDSSVFEQPSRSTTFIPPCMTKEKKQRCSRSFSEGQDNVTGDEEILDSEIEQYLRTPAEIRQIQQFQATVLPK